MSTVSGGVNQADCILIFSRRRRSPSSRVGSSRDFFISNPSAVGVLSLSCSLFADDREVDEDDTEGVLLRLRLAGFTLLPSSPGGLLLLLPLRGGERLRLLPLRGGLVLSDPLLTSFLPSLRGGLLLLRRASRRDPPAMVSEVPPCPHRTPNEVQRL
eukprot:Sspe_Gene.68672::Locus_40483_Transcript_1_1_Confidence_1.000_Length_961::g.68672::m.68672